MPDITTITTSTTILPIGLLEASKFVCCCLFLNILMELFVRLVCFNEKKAAKSLAIFIIASFKVRYSTQHLSLVYLLSEMSLVFFKWKGQK